MGKLRHLLPRIGCRCWLADDRVTIGVCIASLWFDKIAIYKTGGFPACGRRMFRRGFGKPTWGNWNHWFINSLIQYFCDSLIHSSIHCFIHWCIDSSMAIANLWFDKIAIYKTGGFPACGRRMFRRGFGKPTRGNWNHWFINSLIQ